MAEEDKKDSSVSDAFKNALMYFGPKVAAYFIGKGGGGNVEGGLNALKMQGEMDEGFRRFQQSRQPAQRKGLTEYQRASLYMRAQEEASQRKRSSESLKEQAYQRQMNTLKDREAWKEKLYKDPSVAEHRAAIQGADGLKMLLQGDPSNFKDVNAVRQMLKLSGDKRFSDKDFSTVIGSQTYRANLARWFNKKFDEGTHFSPEDREDLMRVQEGIKQKHLEQLRGRVQYAAEQRELTSGGKEKASHTIKWALPWSVYKHDIQGKGVQTPQAREVKFADKDKTFANMIRGGKGGSLGQILQYIKQNPNSFPEAIEALQSMEQ